MHKNSVLLFFLFNASSGFASTFDCEGGRGFRLGSIETINELKVSMKLMSANLKIKQTHSDQEASEEDDSNRCSSTRVSTSGHILTAMHCLSECLESNSVFRPSLPTDQDLKTALRAGSTIGLPKVHPSSSRPQNLGRCKVNVAGYGILDMKIVATGDCDQQTLRERIRGLKKKDKELREKLTQMGSSELNHFIQKICPSDNDFVVIQSDELKSDSQGCLAVATEKPNQGTKIVVSGFPMETTREDGNNSDGKSLFISSGQVANQNFCTLYQSKEAIDREQRRLNAKKKSDSTISEAPQMNMSFRLEDMPKLRTIRPDEMVATKFDFAEILDKSDWSKTLTQVTADAVPGNSGGPLSNSNGEILGVASQIVKADGSIGWIGANTRSECRGAAFFVPIHSIQEKIRSRTQDSGADLSKEIFSCTTATPHN